MTTTSYERELERAGRITITIKGVSMRPLFHADSDAVLIQKCSPESLKNLDIVLFRRTGPQGEQYVLHRIVGRQKDGNYIIAGDNCCDADIVPPQDIIGDVVCAQRGSKPIPLKGIRYVLYERFWCAPYKLRFKVLLIRKKMRTAVKKILRRE